jgi:hypothetical protein
MFFMRKVTAFFTALSVCLISTTIQAKTNNSMTHRELSSILSDAVAGVNAQTPMILDEDTRLDNAATAKNLIIYNNTMVNYNADELDADIFTTNLQEAVIEPLCANPDLVFFRTVNVTMVYRYLGKDGKFITELSKNMGECD